MCEKEKAIRGNNVNMLSQLSFTDMVSQAHLGKRGDSVCICKSVCFLNTAVAQIFAKAMYHLLTLCHLCN